MKLIVLYGDENTGKSITLKIAYEMLKQSNKRETKWFKFYDSDFNHNDFRDVLIVDKHKPYGITKASAVIGRIEDIPFDWFSDYDPNFFDPVGIVKGLDSLEQIVHKYEEKNIEQNCKGDSDYVVCQPTPNPASVRCNPDELKVGFSLEGDYGFVHQNIFWARHSRNLYRNLVELSDCDVVICACSNLKSASSFFEQPISCLIFFLLYCIFNGIPINLYWEGSTHYSFWPQRIREDKILANKLLSYI